MAHALTVSPPLVEVEAEPGETLFQKIRLFNETDQPMTVYPSLENFRAGKEGRAPEYLGDNDPAGPARWIKVPLAKADLPVGEIKELLLNIKVPTSTEPGGHYAALFWSDRLPKIEGIGTASRVPVLFLFKIQGDAKENAALLSFEKKGEGDFVIRLENTGDVHFKPGGAIEVFNWRGKKVAEAPINQLGQSVLPQSQRDFVLSWEGKEKFWGPYSVRAKLIYGEDNNVLVTPKIKFWLWPASWRWMIVEGGLLIVLVWVGVRMAKRKL